MASITDQDIIDHLQEKINFHQQEIKRLQGALNAFTVPSNSAKLGSTSKTSSASAKSAAKPKSLAAVSEVSAGPEAVKTLPIAPKYADSLSMEAKIAFALNEIGSGFSEDIANTMAQYEPKSDAKTLGRQIATPLLTLKNDGLILAEKDGRKERFSLLQQV